MPTIDFEYIAFKFLRDVAGFFVATEAFSQFADGVGSPDLNSLYAALLGALGTGAYRLARDLFAPGE